VKPAVAEEISSAISIPTIGIGSGAQCDGQIMVFHDLVGFSPWYVPKHVRATGNVAGEITKAAREYVRWIGLQKGVRSQDPDSF
jgi:3-methyl-2-oxobutanoate hydroxymethyltransferase